MRRDSLRSLGSILLWIGVVELAASFVAKWTFHFAAFQPFNPFFLSAVIVGTLLLFFFHTG